MDNDINGDTIDVTKDTVCPMKAVENESNSCSCTIVSVNDTSVVVLNQVPSRILLYKSRESHEHDYILV